MTACVNLSPVQNHLAGDQVPTFLTPAGQSLFSAKML